MYAEGLLDAPDLQGKLPMLDNHKADKALLRYPMTSELVTPIQAVAATATVSHADHRMSK